MKLQKTWLPTALSLTLLAGLTFTPVFAQDSDSQPVSGEHHHKEWKHHEGGHCDFKGQLNLTAAQKQKLEAFKKEFKEKHKAEFEELKAKHEQLRELYKSGKGDSEEAQALKKELKESRMAMHKEFKAKMDSILTPAQRQKLEALKEQCKDKHDGEEHHHHHHHHNGGGEGGEGNGEKGGSQGNDSTMPDPGAE